MNIDLNYIWEVISIEKIGEKSYIYIIRKDKIHFKQRQ